MGNKVVVMQMCYNKVVTGQVYLYRVICSVAFVHTNSVCRSVHITHCSDFYIVYSVHCDYSIFYSYYLLRSCCMFRCYYLAHLQGSDTKVSIKLTVMSSQ
jgi:hypothetical protein